MGKQRGKRLGKWAFCAALLVAAKSGFGQDPFSELPVYDPPAEAEKPQLVGPPLQPQEPTPIIQTFPEAQPEPKPQPIARSAKLDTRTSNAQVRTTRTPAQEYIHQRALFRAQQRTQRLERNKWLGISTLRPVNKSARIPDYWYTLPGYYPY